MPNRTIYSDDGSMVFICGNEVMYISRTGAITGRYEANREAIDAMIRDAEKEGAIVPGRHLLYFESICDACHRFMDCVHEYGWEHVKHRHECKDFSPETNIERIQPLERYFQGYVGSCPACGSTNTTDCDNAIETIRCSITGRCHDCGNYFCIECGLSFGKIGAAYIKCPHLPYCKECIDRNGFMGEREFKRRFCRDCEHARDFAEGPNGCCDLEEICEMRRKYSCPYAWDAKQCPEMQSFLQKLDFGSKGGNHG